MYKFLLKEVERNGYDLTAAQDAWEEKVKGMPSVVPVIAKQPEKPQGEKPGRVAGTPGFTKPQSSENDESEWEDIS